VFSATPFEMRAIARVTDETRFVGFGGCQIGRIDRSRARSGFGTCLGVFVAIAMTGFAGRVAGILEELCALAVRVQREGLNDEPVALNTISADDFLRA